MTKYYCIKWPDSQAYMNAKGVVAILNSQDVFVPDYLIDTANETNNLYVVTSQEDDTIETITYRVMNYEDAKRELDSSDVDRIDSPITYTLNKLVPVESKTITKTINTKIY